MMILMVKGFYPSGGMVLLIILMFFKGLGLKRGLNSLSPIFMPQMLGSLPFYRGAYYETGLTYRYVL